MDWIKELSHLFNYWSGVPVLAIMIAVGMKYVRFRNIQDDWEFIGRIKKIYIYPIEGGFRKEVKVVDCTKNGLLSSRDSNNILWKDRHYLIYTEPPPHEEEESKKTKKTEKKSRREPEDYIGAISLHNPKFVPLDTKILEMRDDLNLQMVEYPDGTPTYVRDCGDEIATILRNLSDDNVKYRMGGQSNKGKLNVFNIRKFNKNDPNKNFNHLKLEFSKFVLVNDNSVRDCRDKSRNEELTHANFRPHFVIEAESYCEDKFEYLKIGSVKFHNVLPCTVGEYVNIDPDTGYINNDRQPFLTISSLRKLKTIRPDISLTSGRPVFGITFDILPNNPNRKIAVGDAVYAKKFH